jgi:predicted Zn-dependent protease
VTPLGVNDKAFQAEEDEKMLREAAAELAKAMERAGLFYQDAALESYLNEIARKLCASAGLPAELPLKVKVIKHPFLNAFAAPDGQIYFHSGLLARLENEAQFAVILGHELTHYIQRHTLKEKKLTEQRASLLKLLQVLAITAGAVGGPGAAMALGAATERAGSLWALASLSGYSQELETEADTGGFRFLIKGGYDPQEAPKVFEHLRQDLDVNVQQPFFFATHPNLEQRIDNYRKLLAAVKQSESLSATGATNADRYMESIRELQLENAAMDLEIGRFATAKLVLERHLGRWPTSPRAHFLLGTYFRKTSGSTGTYTPQAIAAYREALRLNPAFGEASRDLGLIYRAQGDAPQAVEALRHYLSLNPDAVDAPIIRGYIDELEKRTER